MHPTQNMLSIQATPVLNEIRTSEFNGAEYTIIPCVALVEGVLWPSNAPSPELALAEEFGKFPSGWDGKPVVLNHPIDEDGNPVSANSPEILEQYMMGQIFNTTLDGDKLKMELWLNDAIVAANEDFKASVDRLLDVDVVTEVSTGLYSMTEVVTGDFGGETYDGIWRNIVPDHLAILEKGSIGACSVEGGCGAPRINEMKPVMKSVMMLSAEHVPVVIENDHACDGCRDASHLCTECEDAKTLANEADTGPVTLLKRIAHKVGNVFNISGVKANETISTSDLHHALWAAINTVETDSYSWIVAIYPESPTSGFVVYEDYTSLKRRSYGFEGDTVTIGSDAEAVRPVTQFVPLTVTVNETKTLQSEDLPMNKAEKITALIANELTAFSAEDQTMLEGLEESVLDKMVPVEAAPAPIDNEEAPAADAPEVVASAAPQTVEEYIKDAPEAIQELLNQGLNSRQQHSDLLVQRVLKGCNEAYTEAELKAKPLSELTKLATLLGQNVTEQDLTDSFIASAPLNSEQSSEGPGYTESADILAFAKKKPAAEAAS